MNGDKKIVRRGSIVLLLFFLLLGIVGSHVFTLQVLEAEKLRLYAWKEHNTVVSFPSRRGEIYDRKGKILALSVPSFSLFFYPSSACVTNREGISEIAKLLSVSVQELENRIGDGKRFVWIQRHLSKEVAEKIRDKLKEIRMRCFGFVEENRRFYPNGDLMLNVLGFTGVDDQGLAGIEYAYDDFLMGDRREIFLKRDAGGGAIPDEKLLELPLGSSRRELILTIDVVLQSFCEDLLKKAVIEHGAQGGCIIVLDSRTAEVLVMAVYPPDRERNMAVSWIFEPGSILKPFIVATALEEAIAYPSMKFSCPGYIVYAGKRVGDIKAHGELTLSEVLKESCNVGMIKLTAKIPPHIIYKYLKAFGFGYYTGIDLPGEEKGILREPDYWDGLSRVVIGIGQSIGVTPIQAVCAMNAIANKGFLLKPAVVKELRSDGKTVRKVKRTEYRRVLSEDTCMMLEKMLIEVVENGTGRKAKIPGIKIAGKTGTAQIAEKGGYVKGKYVASFVGYFPVEDPRWTVLVAIDRPSSGEYYGGEVAAPVFAEVGKTILDIYGWR